MLLVSVDAKSFMPSVDKDSNFGLPASMYLPERLKWKGQNPRNYAALPDLMMLASQLTMQVELVTGRSAITSNRRQQVQALKIFADLGHPSAS